MKTHEYYFKGIDCPNCAAKVEHLLSKLDNIEEVRVNFLSKKIIITYKDNILDLIELEEIIRKIEPDAEISLDDEFEHHESCHEHEHNHGCCHEHGEHDHECFSHEHSEHHYECCHEHHKCCEKKIISVVLFVLGLCFGVTALILSTILKESNVVVIGRSLYIISYLLLAYKIVFKSIKNIIKGNIFDENLLMLIASIGALIINEGLEAILVVLLYTIGEYFQDLALGKSTDEIGKLIELKVDVTHLDNGEDVLTKDVKVGDVIVVKVGERIPLDGIIKDGVSTLDTKVITGESMPQDVKVGDEVHSGCINLSSVLYIEVTTLLNESTTSKIIKMVELASNKKSKTEEFITKFARIYTPIVLILAFVVFLVEWLLIDKFSLNDALNNCFVFLVSSCPCALVISIPLSMYGGIGRCSSFGVLVKGGNYLEALSKTKLICFDKTGTLTKGNFKVSKIYPININLDEFMNYLVSIESMSNHPIAKSIAKLECNKILNINNVRELPGFGIIGYYNNKEILVGNYELMVSNNIEITKREESCSVLYLAIDKICYGYVLIVDEIKEEAYEMINGLNKLDIECVILTGDNYATANDVAAKLNINKVYAKLLPSDKLGKLENIIKNKEKNTSVVYVGDGINDTPSIKLADIGVAIGGLGNDEAVEVSDVVLLNNNMNNLTKAIKISKFTKRILTWNIIFALGVKFIALIIGTLGILGSYGMLLGVFADVGVCLITIINTLRILKFGGKNE